MPKPKGGTSYRLSEDAQDMLAALADRLGLTKTGVLEMAIRKLTHAEFGEITGHAIPPQSKPRLTVKTLAQETN